MSLPDRIRTYTEIGAFYPYRISMWFVDFDKTKLIESWLLESVGPGYTVMTIPCEGAEWCWNKSQGVLKFRKQEDQALFYLMFAD
jgi:hypothetical protein